MAADIQVSPSGMDGADGILTEPALEFIADLHRRFGPRRDELLAARGRRRDEIAAGTRLDFLPETAEIRSGDWTVAANPPALADRRVEITGPTDAKMAINALNSGARVWLADFEDANSPTWDNMVGGQVSLYRAIRGALAYTSPEGKQYRVRDGADLPVILPRPRGWHLPEAHVRVDGAEIAGALMDFGLFFFHNAAELERTGRGPFFYLPKLQSHTEARLWNDIFSHAESVVGIPHGSVRATVLIETITAAFEMDEILYELRDHASGLNAGRWDYLFSIIKTFRDAGPRFVLPDRNAVTMTAPFMRAYTELLVATCHRREAFAMGGMAAFIPSRRDPELNAAALDKVRADKEREAADGFDGSWVAHPDLVPVCAEVFDKTLGERPNQVGRRRPEVHVTADEVLDVAATPGRATRAGLDNAVAVGIRYIAAWLSGNGAAGIFNLMEDAATAEISRSQVWQWVHNDVLLDDGQPVTADLVRAVIAEQSRRYADELGDADAGRAVADRLDDAVALFERVALDDDFAEFLTVPAYRMLGR
jgi:malate synthase